MTFFVSKSKITFMSSCIEFIDGWEDLFILSLEFLVNERILLNCFVFQSISVIIPCTQLTRINNLFSCQ